MTIQLRLDFPQLEQFVRTIDNRSVDSSQAPFYVDGAIRGLTYVLREVVRISRLNAPVDTGALRRSIEGYIGNYQVAGRGSNEADVITRKGQGGTFIATSLQRATRLDGRISVGAFYGFLVHETLLPFGTGPKQARVKSKGSQYQVGGKFVERALQTVAPYFGKLLARGMAEAAAEQVKRSKLRGSKPVAAFAAAQQAANRAKEASLELISDFGLDKSFTKISGATPNQLGFGRQGGDE